MISTLNVASLNKRVDNIIIKYIISGKESNDFSLKFEIDIYIVEASYISIHHH
jgi:hypothetical protein